MPPPTADTNAPELTEEVQRTNFKRFRTPLEEQEGHAALPERPTLVDFFKKRLLLTLHQYQTAGAALKLGMEEELVFAGLVHDIGHTVKMPDHGYWGAQLLAPYVSERVQAAVKYHQALRFFPDKDYGYQPPAVYFEARAFGNPDGTLRIDPYIHQAHEEARRHKYYEAARWVTVLDTHSEFESWGKLTPAEASAWTLDPFVDVIGRHFKQPKEGLGYDGSPVAHMWRTMIFPKRFL